MLILHGFAFSNYYNIVKHVLLHKGIPFEEDLRYGGDEEWLALSPVGKVPAITTEEGGHLSESSVCCDYLEERYPDVPLYPSDPYSRNYVRQIMKVGELYIELPCRRLIPFVFQDLEAPAEMVEEIRAVVERGLEALRRLAEFDPWLAGSEQTMADIYLRYVFVVASMIGTAKMDWDILAEADGLSDWFARMADSDVARKVDADQQANAPEFMAYLQSRFAA